MSKHYLPLLAYSCLLLVIFSCNNKSAPGEAYTLKMRLAAGDTFNQNMDMGMKMNFEAAGQKLEMTMDMKVDMAFKVTAASEGSRDLTLTYKNMEVQTEMKGMEGMNKQMNNEALKNIIGKTVTLKINNKNEITDVVGFEEALLSDTTNLAARNMIKEMFTKEKMNSLFSMMFQLYPEKPIRVGDEWEREVKTAMAGLDMKVLGKYTLISVKDSVATIKMDGKYIADGKMAEGMEMKMDGTQTGEVNLKLADGYLKNSQIKIDLDGSMKVMGQNVPVKMKGNYIIKGD